MKISYHIYMVTSHVHNIYANQDRYDNDMHEGQGRKCREISAIYRRYITYRRRVT